MSTIDRQPLFATLELDGQTGDLRAIFTSAQDDYQFGIVERALKRYCRPTSFSWIKRLIRLAGRG